MHPCFYFTLLISSIFISFPSLKTLPSFDILFLQIKNLYPAISLSVASQPCNNSLYFLASLVTTVYILKSKYHIFFVNILSPFLSISLFSPLNSKCILYASLFCFYILIKIKGKFIVK